MVVVTLKLDDELHSQLKKLALNDDRSLQTYLKKIVKDHLSNNEENEHKTPNSNGFVKKSKDLFDVQTAFMTFPNKE